MLASALLMFPAIDLLAKSSVLTWLGAIFLIVTSYLMFRHRTKLRTSFLLPIVYIPALTATHFRITTGIDAAKFTVSTILFLVGCVAALLIDAFWSPYKDDLADLEHLDQSKS